MLDIPLALELFPHQIFDIVYIVYSLQHTPYSKFLLLLLFFSLFSQPWLTIQNNSMAKRTCSSGVVRAVFVYIVASCVCVTVGMAGKRRHITSHVNVFFYFYVFHFYFYRLPFALHVLCPSLLLLLRCFLLFRSHTLMRVACLFVLILLRCEQLAQRYQTWWSGFFCVRDRAPRCHHHPPPNACSV